MKDVALKPWPPESQRKEFPVALICRCGAEHAEHLISNPRGCAGWHGHDIISLERI